jgi:Mn-dependent DtxR family transcriptional regulator
MLPPKIPDTIRSFLQTYLPTGTFGTFELLWSQTATHERLEARLTRKPPSVATTLRRLARATERR